MMSDKLMTHDDYLDELPDDQREALEDVRHVIRQAAPEAVETISYGIPAFSWKGKKLVAYGAAAKHLSFYPMSGETVEAFQDELEGFATSKGTIRFTPENPLPADLVQRLVAARIADLE